jgi:hypothetical protein
MKNSFAIALIVAPAPLAARAQPCAGNSDALVTAHAGGRRP